MAIFQTQKSSVLLPITFLLLLLNVKVMNSEILEDETTELFSFSIPKFGSYQPNLIFQGDASSTVSYIQLTNLTSTGEPVVNSLGRALYSAPVHIWDSDTEVVASFVTSFSFIIDAPIKDEKAEGLAFFLAPIDTEPSDENRGGHLGIYPSEKLVAVEFDTFYNEEYDTETPHIGINVENMKSLNTTDWEFKNGTVANVFIVYDASTKTLNAALFYPSEQIFNSVSLVVDLKEVLPEWVRIGFSATTGLDKQHVETHNVLSWYFYSVLPNPSSTSTSTSIDEMFKKFNIPQLPLYDDVLGRKANYKKNMHLSNYAMHGRMI